MKRIIVGCLLSGACMGIGFAAWIGWINPRPEQVGTCCEKLQEIVGIEGLSGDIGEGN